MGGHDHSGGDQRASGTARLSWGLIAFASIGVMVGATVVVLTECLARAILAFGATCPAPAWWIAVMAVAAGGATWTAGAAWDRWSRAGLTRTAFWAAALTATVLIVATIRDRPPPW